MMTDTPTSYQLPLNALEAWSALPSHSRVNLPLTKSEVDHLFFSINDTIVATDALRQALVAAMSGDTASANSLCDVALNQLIEGQNRLRQLLMAAIVGGMQASPK